MKYIRTILFVFLCIGQNIYTQSPPLTGSGNQYHQYLWATYNYHKGDAETSYNAFQDLFSTTPPPFAYIGYMPLLFALEQYKSIAQIVPYLDAFVQDHMETQLIFAQSLELNGDLTLAHAKHVKLAEQFPHNPEVMYHVIRSHVTQNNFETALLTLHEYFKHNTISPVHYLFYYLEGQIYTAMQQLEFAETSLKKSIVLNNRFEQSWLLLGLIYELQHKEDQALLIYQEYLDTVGSSKRILQQKNALGSQRKKQTVSHKQEHLEKHIKSLMYIPPKQQYAHIV